MATESAEVFDGGVGARRRIATSSDNVSGTTEASLPASEVSAVGIGQSPPCIRPTNRYPVPISGILLVAS